jgi:hypothetical protein
VELNDRLIGKKPIVVMLHINKEQRRLQKQLLQEAMIGQPSGIPGQYGFMSGGSGPAYPSVSHLAPLNGPVGSMGPIHAQLLAGRTTLKGLDVGIQAVVAAQTSRLGPGGDMAMGNSSLVSGGGVGAGADIASRMASMSLHQSRDSPIMDNGTASGSPSGPASVAISASVRPRKKEMEQLYAEVTALPPEEQRKKLHELLLPHIKTYKPFLSKLITDHLIENASVPELFDVLEDPKLLVPHYISVALQSMKPPNLE